MRPGQVVWSLATPAHIEKICECQAEWLPSTVSVNKPVPVSNIVLRIASAVALAWAPKRVLSSVRCD